MDNKKKANLRLLGEIAVTTLMMVGPAHAQDAVAPPVTAPAAATDSTNDIVVTAQKRAERLEDVPLSIVAASAQTLARAGVSDVSGLTQVVPGLKIDRFGAYTQPSIRGISTLIISPGSDANVAMYVDGVYQPSQAANTFDFPDIDRIEVAKGPQGTLFGRNATGGAIQIFTRKPTLSEPTGDFAASYGRFNDMMVKGYISVPLVPEAVGASVSGYWEKRDSYNHNIVPGGPDPAGFRSGLVRGKLLVEPSGNVSFTLSGYYSKRQDPEAFQGLPLAGNTVAQSIPGAIIPDQPYEVAFDPAFPARLTVEAWGVNLNGEIDLGAAKLTSITAYTHVNAAVNLDPDYSQAQSVYYFISQPNRTFSQEVNLASTSKGPFNWVAGLFYYHDKGQQDPLSVVGAGINIYNQIETNAYAAFAEVNYRATDRLTFIAGARYNHEKKVVGTAFNTPVLGAIQSKTWDDVTPRFSVKYAVTSDANLYATFSQGFKSGTFDVQVPGSPALEPEKVTSYEVGFKYAGGGSRLNIAGFYYDYKDLQVQTNQGLLSILENAANAEIYGIDADGAVSIASGLNLNGSVTYLHARYKNYIGSTNIPQPGGGNATGTADLSGNHNVRSPTWTASLGASYEHDVGAGILSVNGNVFYSSKFYFDAPNRVAQDEYAIVNANIGLALHGSGVKLTVWGKNLTNSKTIMSTNIGGLADGVSYAAPRTFGVQVGYTF